MSGTTAEVWINPLDPVTGQFTGYVDVTSIALEGSSTRRLNNVSQAQVRMPMESAIGGAGSLLKIYFVTDLSSTPILHFHGRVLNCETTADENGGYTVYNAADPLELWQSRPVRDPPDGTDPGDMTKPDLVQEFGDPTVDPSFGGPRLIQAMIEASENVALIPSKAEGPLFLEHDGASFPNGSKSMTGAPVDWPMTMAQLAALLVSTGELDIIITPIEMSASGFTCDGNVVYNIARIDTFNGNYGLDLTSSVVFQYGMGLRNVRALRWNEDMTQMCNKLWYYLGPRVETSDDPAGDQHWRANIQGDDPAFNSDGVLQGAWGSGNSYVLGDVVTNVISGNTYYFIAITAHTSSATDEPGVGANWTSFWTFWLVPSGGRLSPPASSTNNIIGTTDYFSRCAYGVRMDVQIFDARGDEATEGREMYRLSWQREQYLRALPRNLVHVTPTRDTAIGEFDIGDLVLVEAVGDVKGGFSGAQRIYSYTISWDQDSVCALSELQVSSDQEPLQ